MNKSLRSIAILSAALAPLLSIGTSHAAVNAQMYLNPASQAVTVGGTVTATLYVNTGGNQAFGWQADLKYSTSYFGSVSVSIPAGSPYTTDPNGGDTASGGAIRMSRVQLSSNHTAYSGPVAVITLTSTAAGSTTLDFEPICASSSQSTPCSFVGVSDGTTTTNVLASTAGGSYTINAAPSSGGGSTGGGTSSGSTGGSTSTGTKPTSTSGTKTGSTSTKTTAPTTSSTPTPTPTTPNPTATNDSQSGADLQVGAPADVVLTLLDQDGKPVSNATVTVGSVTGTTGKDGKVTLHGLTPGTASGSVTYKGQKQTITLTVQDGATAPTQSTKLTIKLKKTSAVTPIALTVGTLIIVAAVALVLAGPDKGLKSKFRKKPGAGPSMPPVHHAAPTPPAPKAPVAAAIKSVEIEAPIKEEPPEEIKEQPKPEVKQEEVQHEEAEQEDRPKTESKPEHKQEGSERLDPLAPGTTFTPNDTRPHPTISIH